MKDVILIPAVYTGSRDLKDKTKKLLFDTNEITPKQAADLQICVGGYVYLAIKPEPFLKTQIETIGELKSDFDVHDKTPGNASGILFTGYGNKSRKGMKIFSYSITSKWRALFHS